MRATHYDLSKLSWGALAYLFCAASIAAETSVAEPVTRTDQVDDTCRRISQRLASVDLDECRALALEPTGAAALSGTPILMREYPPLGERDPLGRVLLFGGIHGDELSSTSTVFKWMGILDRFHSGLFHWRIVPLLNPDGLLRRPAQRMNGAGVDLNRNFPCPDWHESTREYWVERTGRNPRRYPGPDPLSEPESRWLAEEIERFQPSAIISVHAPHGVLDFDGPSRPPDSLGSLELKLLGTYPGSLGRYAGVQMDIPVITIELPSALSMPTGGEVRRIWIDLVRWLREELSRPPNDNPAARVWQVSQPDAGD